MANPEDLTIRSELEGDLGCIELGGRLVAESRWDFKSEWRELNEAAPSRVVISLRKLEYIDSAGLAALIGAWKQAKERGGEMVVAEVNPSLKALFEVSSLNKFFKIFPTAEAARAYLRSEEKLGSSGDGKKR